MAFSSWRSGRDLTERKRLLAEQAKTERIHAQEQEEKERAFPLSDAYKKAPAFFRDSQYQHLYGRIAPGKSESVLAALSAQDLDAKLTTRRAMDDAVAQSERVHHDAMAMTSFGVAVRDGAERDLYVNKLAQAAVLNHEANINRLCKDNLLFPIDRETRVRVLDISDHYAKLQGLDGDLRDKIFFLTPNDILVK